MNGLIIIGYQGIGKSSLSNYNHICIDFESSFFKIDNNNKIDNWHIIYCKQAVSLAKQGFIVLISSHECVRKELSNYEQDDFDIVTIAPAYKLKKQWIEKLRIRYSEDPSDKNYAALRNAEDHYIDDITEIASDPNFSHIFINTTKYDLYSILNGLRGMFGTKRRAYIKYRDDNNYDES